jgi:hypothetical protein
MSGQQGRGRQPCFSPHWLVGLLKERGCDMHEWNVVIMLTPEQQGVMCNLAD